MRGCRSTPTIQLTEVSHTCRLTGRPSLRLSNIRDAERNMKDAEIRGEHEGE